MSAADSVIFDATVRHAAFAHLQELMRRDETLPSTVIQQGFRFGGERWPYWNPQRGIFKPSALPYLLSIKTVFPRKGARVWYDDQREAHEQIYTGADVLDYASMGTNPGAAENQWLRVAATEQVPVIYFLGVAPGRYQRSLAVSGDKVS